MRGARESAAMPVHLCVAAAAACHRGSRSSAASAEARLAVSAKDAAVRLAAGGCRGARARGTMPSIMATHTCVAAASPRLPKRENDLRALVVGQQTLTGVDVLGLRAIAERRRPGRSRLPVSSGRMALVRSQTTEPFSQQKSARSRVYSRWRARSAAHLHRRRKKCFDRWQQAGLLDGCDRSQHAQS